VLRFTKTLIVGGILLPTLAQANILEEVVVTANRADQTIAEVNSNISVITAGDLRRINPTHINEAMQRVAGAWISRGNGQEHLTALRSPVLTGAGACGAFLMAQDGIPLRASGFCNVNQLFDAHSEHAGGIEVIKGPASAVYGANAMHGMINIRTPAIDGSSGAGLEAGPHDYYRTSITLGQPTWRLDFNGTTDGGYKDASGFDQQKLSATALGQWLGFSATTGLSVTNLNQETSGFIQGPQAYKDKSLAKQNPNPEAFRDSRSARIYSRLERPLNAGKLVLTPYARDTKMTFIQHFLPGQALEENAHTSIGIQSAWYKDRWTVGADFEVTEGELREYQPDPTTGSDFLVATIPAGEHYNYQVDANTQALFARYQWPLTDATKLTAGARWERVQYDYDNLMLTGRTRDDGTTCARGGCRFSRPADRQDTFSNLSPQLGLTHFITAEQQLYANLSRGFRAPQTSELYRLQGGQEVTDIDVVQLDSLELGIRGGGTDWSYDASLYAMKKSNVIFRDSDSFNVDNAKTRHRGLELTLSKNLNEQLTTNIFWSYARHQYANEPEPLERQINGNDIDTAPRQMGSANVQWQFSDAYSAELEWVHMGKYYEDPENLHAYPGHDLLNLRLSLAINDDWQAYIRIMNLTDTRYAERADFAFGNDRYFVGEPASLYAGFRATF
jgi:iron complex outermembrane recepter protein